MPFVNPPNLASQPPDGEPPAGIVPQSELPPQLYFPGSPYLRDVQHYIDWQVNHGTREELRRFLFEPEVMPAILQSQHAPLIAGVCVAAGRLMEDDARHIAEQVSQSPEARATLMASLNPSELGAAAYVTRFLPPSASTESFVRGLNSPEPRAAIAGYGTGFDVAAALTAVAQHLPQDEFSDRAFRRLLAPETRQQLVRPKDKVEAASAVVRRWPAGDADRMVREVLATPPDDVDAFASVLQAASRVLRDPVRAQVMVPLCSDQALRTLGERGDFSSLALGIQAIPMLPEGLREAAAQALLTDRARETLLYASESAPGDPKRLNLDGLSMVLRAAEFLSEDGKRALVRATLTEGVRVAVKASKLSNLRRETILSAIGYLPEQDRAAWHQAVEGPQWAATLAREAQAPSGAGPRSPSPQGGPGMGGPSA